MQIFVSGSLAYDRIMDFPGRFSDHIQPEKIHVLSVSFVVKGLTEKFGGTAGNIAYSLALLGERPLILATAGRDFDQYAQWLRRHDLPLDGIKLIQEELTGGAYITTDIADCQITGFNPGAMKFPSEFQFDSVKADRALAIVAPGNVEDMLTYSRVYKERRIPYIFDAGQQIPALSVDALVEIVTGSEMFVSNDYELQMMEQATKLGKSELLRRTKAIVTTLGEKGSLVCTLEEEVEIPAVPVSKVLNPTGAGDAYRAGIIKGLVMEKGLVEAAQMGATCASYVVECYGTQDHRYSEEEFWSRYKLNFG